MKNYRYVTAEINTGKPFIITDDINGAVSVCQKYDTMIGQLDEYIFECVEDDGVYTGIKLIIIDFEKVSELNHIEIIREGGHTIPYEELVGIIKSEIRNVSIDNLIS